MIMEKYKIRKIEEGKMLFTDAKEIIDLCIINKIMHGEIGNYVFIYHEAGPTSPEGFYKDNYCSTIKAFQNATQEDVDVLLNALEEKGIMYKPTSNEYGNYFDYGEIVKNNDLPYRKDIDISISNGEYKVSIWNANDGKNGKYNADDKDDLNFLRYSVSEKNRTEYGDVFWDYIPEISSSTRILADTSDDTLFKIAKVILDNVTVLSKIYNKKVIGERLSLLRADNFESFRVK